jgi:tetratricopeptide (TPR) repeat protein
LRAIVIRSTLRTCHTLFYNDLHTPMQIRRDYTQPLFGKRRRGGDGRLLFGYVLFLSAFVLFVYLQFGRLQLIALDAVGMSPTATPFASDLAMQGQMLFSEGRLRDAAEMYRRAVEQQPENISYLYEYGRLLLELSVDTGNTQTPIDIGDRMIDLAPNDPRGYIIKARALFNDGRAAEAVPVGIAGLDLAPDNGLLYGALAQAYTDIGRYQQGIRFGEQAVQFAPDDPFPHRAFAYTLIYVGRRDEAIDQLEQAVALAPTFINTYFELALQYRASDQDTLAVATYERILVLDRQNARANLRLCQMYAKVGQYGQAAGYCDEAIRIDSDNDEAYRELGRMRYNRRDYESAIESFQICADLTTARAEIGDPPRNIECWYLRGLSYYYLNNCDDAWTTLQEALIMSQQLIDKGNVPDNIRAGLGFIVQNCPKYSSRPLPTDIPPTAIPPTPIGAFGS